MKVEINIMEYYYYWEAFSLAVILLFFKMFIVVGVQGYNRIKYKAFVKPEDAAEFGHTSPVSEELPIVQLASSTLRNDLENIPIFLFIALAYIHMQCWLTGAYIYFLIFVISRYFHSYFFINPKQPVRNRMYILGQLVNFIICGHILLAIISKRFL